MLQDCHLNISTMISTSGTDLALSDGTTLSNIHQPKATKLIHTWTIDHINYHCNPELDFQDYLDSSKFSPYKFDQERLQFFIRLHPRGDKQNVEEIKEHVPVYLHMESKEPDGVFVNVKMYIIKESGVKVNIRGMLY